jgi:hypothetical protein
MMGVILYMKLGRASEALVRVSARSDRLDKEEEEQKLDIGRMDFQCGYLMHQQALPVKSMSRVHAVLHVGDDGGPHPSELSNHKCNS